VNTPSLNAAEIDRKHSRDRAKSRQLSLFPNRENPPQIRPRESAAKTTARIRRKFDRENPPQESTALFAARIDRLPLHIEKLPEPLQWWHEPRYWLIHAESGLRVPGSWSEQEAQEILDLSKDWNWSIDDNRRVACGLQLMALAEAVCKRSGKGGAK
jgi:hypothetical protein